MRRTAIALVALAVVALGAAGCSSSPEQVTASKTSPPRPEARSELAPDDPAVPSPPDDPSDSPGELPEGFEDNGSGIDDMLDQFESELGVAGRCLDLLMEYASLLGSAFGALPGESDRDAVIDELRATLPSDLHDELQTIAEGLEAFEREGFAGAGVLADPAFIDANDAIVSWLQSSCDAGGNSGPNSGSGSGEGS